jgi:NAD-dependent dihydropyrimidine dehydrogenase PreA subunit
MEKVKRKIVKIENEDPCTGCGKCVTPAPKGRSK